MDKVSGIKLNGIRKNELASLYEISSDGFRKLLNEVYYDELVASGYNKNCVILPPKVVRKIFELHGEPF